ncbi:MAG: tetratricopeptide repeat protein [Desulfobaccales bacterium]
MQKSALSQVEPFLKRVHLMENHDQAYFVWKDAGVREKILVHVDAHDDLSWCADRSSLNIGNFICQALKEGMVREIFWVVPDRTLGDAGSRKPLVRSLQKILAKYPGKPHPLKAERDLIAGAILGRPLRVCTLQGLPLITEKVLLDIDVDYMVIPKACHSSDQHRGLPWCWPDALATGLKDMGIQAELVTIAYSVEGGFTPLQWKYLGDELARRLDGVRDHEPFLRGMTLLREGARAKTGGNLPQAVQTYLQAREFLPDNPALEFLLAGAYADMGRPTDARECHRRARELDPAYGTAYGSGGFWYYWDRRYPEAEQEHRRTLTLNPEDAYAHFGLGQLATRFTRWQEAEAWLRKSLELDDHLVDAWRTLGKVLSKRGRGPEAIEAYERSLHLSLRGYLPIGAPIFSHNDRALLMDPDHFRIHTILGRLYAAQGQIDTAIISLRMGIAAGDDGCVVRSRLARLFLKKRQGAEVRQEVWAAIKMIPRDIGNAVQRAWYHIRLAFKAKYRAIKGTK